MKRLIYGVIGVAMAAWTASEMRAESAMTAMDEQPETTTEEKAEEQGPVRDLETGEMLVKPKKKRNSSWVTEGYNRMYGKDAAAPAPDGSAAAAEESAAKGAGGQHDRPAQAIDAQESARQQVARQAAIRDGQGGEWGAKATFQWVKVREYDHHPDAMRRRGEKPRPVKVWADSIGTALSQSQSGRADATAGSSLRLTQAMEHQAFVAETAVEFAPAGPYDFAGLELTADGRDYYLFGKAMVNGRPAVVARQVDGGRSQSSFQPLQRYEQTSPLWLRIKSDGSNYSFFYSTNRGSTWTPVVNNLPALKPEGLRVTLYSTSL